MIGCISKTSRGSLKIVALDIAVEEVITDAVVTRRIRRVHADADFEGTFGVAGAVAVDFEFWSLSLCR